MPRGDKRTRAQMTQPAVNPDSDFPGLIFKDEAQKVRFTGFKNRPLIPTRFICRNSMRALGLDSETFELFKAVGMGGFYNLMRPTYARLTWEFLSSLVVARNKKNEMRLYFRLMNQDIDLSLSQFAAIFGLKVHPEHTPPDWFNVASLWIAISGQSYRPATHMSSQHIHSPVIRMWQRYMGWTIFGRNEPHNVRTEEISILGQALRRTPHAYRINIPYHFARHLNKLAKSTAPVPVYIGGLVTHIARRVVGFTEAGHTPVFGDILFDTAYLSSPLDWIRVGAMGERIWLINKKPSITLPNRQLITLKADELSYLLPIEEDAPPTIPTRTYARRDPQTVASSSTAPPPTTPPTAPPPAQYYDLHPDVAAMMERMSLGLGTLSSDFTAFRQEYRDDMSATHARIDRLYADQSLGMYPLYDDYARRGHIQPTGPFPSYYTWPDGGYSVPDARGGFHLQPDYFSGPVAPSGGDFQGGGWYGGAPSGLQGDPGASGSGAGTSHGSEYIDVDDDEDEDLDD